MPYRKITFANDEVYHVLNRGVAEAPIFLVSKEYLRFLNLMEFYHYTNPRLSYSHYNQLNQKEKEKFRKDLNSSLLVEILAYCLMPNHFHLLLRQIADKGIPTMMAKLQNAYARYFNLRHKRPGALFQSMFKAIRVETDEQLLHVSRYIHLNPSSSYLIPIKKLPLYPWSSLPEYLGKKPLSFVKPKLVLNLIGGSKRYEEFVFKQAEYQRELNKIKHLILENP